MNNGTFNHWNEQQIWICKNIKVTMMWIIIFYSVIISSCIGIDNFPLFNYFLFALKNTILGCFLTKIWCKNCLRVVFNRNLACLDRFVLDTRDMFTCYFLCGFLARSSKSWKAYSASATAILHLFHSSAVS